MKTLLVGFTFLVLLAWGISGGAGTFPPDALVPDGREPISAPGVTRDVSVYEGLGTWVDIFDFDPAVAGDPPPVTPDSLADMAGVGVETLYFQAANETDAEPSVVDPDVLGSFIVSAHEVGIRVVGWFVPRHGDVDRDLAYVSAIDEFEYEGHRFDGIALDIEWTQTEEDHDARSGKAVELARRSAELLGDDALGAIVVEPLLVSEVNPDLWPGYPYEALAGSVDVLLPMSYWTNRTEDSGLREGFGYTAGNMLLLREAVGSEIPMHVIGGIADATSAVDDAGLVRAATEGGAIGWSVYDWNTTVSSAWEALRPAARSR